MRIRIVAVAAFSLAIFALVNPERRVAADGKQTDLVGDFQERLQKLGEL